jgi:hypothetical protein
MVRSSSGALRSVGKKLSAEAQLSLWLLAVAVMPALGAGCSKKIGDSCRYSTDCSAMGDRLCDITQPGGYCTQYPCEPNTCPAGESACVAFTDPSCPNLPSSRRFVRYFCMETCSQDSDCRGEYRCKSMGNDVVDLNPEKRSVCVVRSDLSASAPDAASNAVCEPIDAAIFGDLLAPDGGGEFVDGAL